MKKRFDVFNASGTGGSVGIYEADDEDGAIRAYLADARDEDPPDPGLRAVEVEVCRVCDKRIDHRIGGDEICLPCATDKLISMITFLLGGTSPGLEEIIRETWQGEGWAGDASAQETAVAVLDRIRSELTDE